MLDLLKKIVDSYAQQDFDVSLSFKGENYRTNVFLNGKKEKLKRGFDSGIMISVSKNGKVFRQATPTLSESYIHKLIKESVTRLNSIESMYLPESNFKMLRGEVVNISADNVLPQDEVIPFLMDSSSIQHDWISFIRSSLTETCEERITVNSNGGVFHDKKFFSDYYLDLMGSRGEVNQNRSNGGVVFQGAINNLFLSGIAEQKENLTRDLDSLLSATVCSKMKGDLLLPSDQMYIQIHESIGHPLELDRILGDERNYAGGSFVKKSDFGTLKYGPDFMNIVFAPGEDSQPAGQAFDDTGLPAKNEFLIKDGKLVAGIGGFESQKKIRYTWYFKHKK